MDAMEMKLDEIMMGTLSLQEQIHKLVSTQIDLINRLKLCKSELKIISNSKLFT